jgi:DNA polymerase-3 subunit epsilon
MPSPFSLFDYPLVVIDVETTGISHRYGGVIDVGVLRIEDGQVVETFQHLINPGSRIPAFITQLTGITNDDLASAPYFADIAPQLQLLLKDCIFVAHNARFDYSFIKEEFRRLDIRYAPKILCTVKLSRGLYPQHRHHKLDALIERFDLQVADRHRAFGDAQATWQALEKMVQQAPVETVQHLVKQQLRQPSLPPQLAKETIDALPEGPGVYIFKNETGAPLYVGKSINIRSRVLSHFSDDVNAPKEMQLAQQTAHIETISTTGELSALLKESELIKQMLPIYNRLLRRKDELVLAIRHTNSQGFPVLKVERHSQIEPGSIGQVMAVFTSTRQAKELLLTLAKEHHLCHKLLGLQKTSSACFAQQLGTCLGACVSQESATEYERRFNTAFTNVRLQRWPYDGPIMVTEKKDAESTSFVLDQWCLVGTVVQRDQEISFTATSAAFDLDQYKILRQYLTKPHLETTIQLLQSADIDAMADMMTN